ncbi:MAG: hypothetical protein KGL39_17960 [Patescibacteria group bacterium]|nr:hypothetical protein [Patescibacteria group bacterium]
MSELTEHSFTKLEVQKYAFRQTKNGTVVSFLIHPNDIVNEVALMPLGTRVLLAVAEISDEQSQSSPST